MSCIRPAATRASRNSDRDRVCMCMCMTCHHMFPERVGRGSGTSVYDVLLACITCYTADGCATVMLRCWGGNQRFGMRLACVCVMEWSSCVMCPCRVTYHMSAWLVSSVLDPSQSPSSSSSPWLPLPLLHSALHVSPVGPDHTQHGDDITRIRYR